MSQPFDTPLVNNPSQNIPDWSLARIQPAMQCLRPDLQNPFAIRFDEIYKQTPALAVKEIPKIMKFQLGWRVAAKAMEKWFDLPGREMTTTEKASPNFKLSSLPSDYVVSDLIQWSWLDRFESIRQSYNSINSILNTPNAKTELARLCKQQLPALLTATGNASSRSTNTTFRPLRIGNNPIAIHDDWQFQFTRVGYTPGSLDELYGSLGNFAIYAALTKGQIEPVPNHLPASSSGYRLRVQEVGIYVKDTFDFIGPQYLGHWNNKGMGINIAAGIGNAMNQELKLTNISRLGIIYPVGNEHYRQYRTLTNKGGDYYLLSDIKRQPVEFIVNI